MLNLFKFQLWLIAALHGVFFLFILYNSLSYANWEYFSISDLIPVGILLIPTLLTIIAAFRFSTNNSNAWWLHFITITIEAIGIIYLLFQLQPFLYSSTGNWDPGYVIEPCGFYGCGIFIFYAKVAFIATITYLLAITNALYFRLKVIRNYTLSNI